MEEKKMPKYMNFVNGGIAGLLSTCFVHPLDLIKMRMQTVNIGNTKRTSTFMMTQKLFVNEGLFGFYSGLSAALVRQCTYTTTRMGIYSALLDRFSDSGKPAPFLYKASFGMLAGAMGSLLSTPAEVSMVRMSVDTTLPISQRRKYKNVIDAMFRIFKEEGFLTLYRGGFTAMIRAIIINGAQLATYSQSKEMLLNSGYFTDNTFCHFSSAMISGIATSVVSMPIDVVKTRLQNMKTIDGKPEYSGGLDVFTKILKHEGVSALWKGFLPFYLRVGSQTVLVFIILEKANYMYKIYFL